MFDISFIELLVIFVVALLVLGPEKLPGAVRTGALWFGRAKRSFNKAKAEIEQQLNADEIRRQLHNESILADIEQARKDADKLVKDTKAGLEKTRDDINKSISLPPPSVPVVTNSAIEGLPTEPPFVPSVPSEPEPEPEPKTPTSPVQDFYNNPPAGVVSLQGRKVLPPEPIAPSDDPAQKD